MTAGKAGAVCAALALAAHAALLLGSGPRHGGVVHQAGNAVSARYVVEPPPARALADATASAPAEEPAAPTPLTTGVAEAAAVTPSGPEAEQPEAQPPTFEQGAAPALSFPDAPLPAEGVKLRAYVVLQADGSPVDISTGSPPGSSAAPPGFQKAAERALRQARFTPGPVTGYCLLVTFEPDAPAPQLAWLPGAARDAARCLTGASTLAPRELVGAAPP